MTINIITRCTRTQNLKAVESSIFSEEIDGVEIKWHIIFDINALSYLPSRIIKEYNKYNLHYIPGNSKDMSHQSINKVIDMVPDEEWVYVLDDDNELHHNFLKRVREINEENPSTPGIIFSQYVGGIDFSGLEVRIASPENVKVQKIDMGQFLLRKDLIGESRIVENQYVGDGLFIEKLYSENKSSFIIIDEILCNYNSISAKENAYTLPRILLLGSEQETLSTKFGPTFFEKKLNVKKSTPESVVSDIKEFNPDCIYTVGDELLNSRLSLMSSDFRMRWIHSPNDIINGDYAYNCSMDYILRTSISDELVSVFSPMYKTGAKLIRTYESLRNQSYSNWEWVLVFDSNDLETLNIAQDIAKNDPRVIIYNLQDKSKGLIGEVKYRACALSRGKYLLELDHDDYLLPDAIDLVVRAFKKFPDAGFVYSDAAEIDENHNSLKYGEGFAMGYGYYKKETHLGREYEVAATPNLNPLTIRHIVGVPNHVRVWERETYFKIGGHNRRLSIADDYELLVRTFLNTMMVKIPRCTYLQFMWGGNSQNSTRADIQRRVNSIAVFYNTDIKKRFEEFGLEDYGFDGSRIPRYGDKENFINYVFDDF